MQQPNTKRDNKSVADEAAEYARQNSVFANVDALSGNLKTVAQSLLQQLEQNVAIIKRQNEIAIKKIQTSNMSPEDASGAITDIENDAISSIQRFYSQAATQLHKHSAVISTERNISRSIATSSHSAGMAISYRDYIGDSDVRYSSAISLEQQQQIFKKAAHEKSRERTELMRTINESKDRSPEQVAADTKRLEEIDREIALSSKKSAAYKKAGEVKRVSEYGDEKVQRRIEGFLEDFAEDVGFDELKEEVRAGKKSSRDYRADRAANVATIKNIQQGTWSSKALGLGLSKDVAALTEGKGIDELRKMQATAFETKQSADQSGDIDAILKAGKELDALTKTVEKLNKVQQDNLKLGEINRQKEQQKERQERQEGVGGGYLGAAAMFGGGAAKIYEDLFVEGELRKTRANTVLQQQANQIVMGNIRGVDNLSISDLSQSIYAKQAENEAIELQKNSQLVGGAQILNQARRNTRAAGLFGLLNIFGDAKAVAEGTVSAEKVAATAETIKQEKIAANAYETYLGNKYMDRGIGLARASIGNNAALDYAKKIAITGEYGGGELDRLSNYGVSYDDVIRNMPTMVKGRFKKGEFGSVFQTAGLLEQKGVMTEADYIQLAAQNNRAGGTQKDLNQSIAIGIQEGFDNDFIKELGHTITDLNVTMQKYGGGNMQLGQSIMSLVSQFKKSGFTDSAARAAAVESIQKTTDRSSSTSRSFATAVEANELMNKGLNPLEAFRVAEMSLDEVKRAKDLLEKKAKGGLTEDEKSKLEALESGGVNAENISKAYYSKLRKSFTTDLLSMPTSGPELLQLNDMLQEGNNPDKTVEYMKKNEQKLRQIMGKQRFSELMSRLTPANANLSDQTNTLPDTPQASVDKAQASKQEQERLYAQKAFEKLFGQYEKSPTKGLEELMAKFAGAIASTDVSKPKPKSTEDMKDGAAKTIVDGAESFATVIRGAADYFHEKITGKKSPGQSAQTNVTTVNSTKQLQQNNAGVKQEKKPTNNTTGKSE
jgi:hypothetical protein